MSNMSYCRFENTARDLHDCQMALQERNTQEEKDMSESEKMAKKQLIFMCCEIAEEFGDH